MNQQILRAIEHANSRDVGQFHVFEGTHYSSTWRSLETAQAVADKTIDGAVYNSSGQLVSS